MDIRESIVQEVVAALEDCVARFYVVNALDFRIIGV